MRRPVRIGFGESEYMVYRINGKYENKTNRNKSEKHTMVYTWHLSAVASTMSSAFPGFGIDRASVGFAVTSVSRTASDYLGLHR